MAAASRGSRPESSTAIQSTFKKSVLSNGIRVVTEQIPYVRSVSIGFWIDVGSRDEDATMNGISHFVEHMVFKGTKHYRAYQIARSLESVGGYLNAFTSKENTCFYARTLDEHLQKAVEVLSDLIQHPLLNPKEIEKEKQVVLEEIKNIEDDPEDLIHDYFDRMLFPRHSLGFPVVGTSASVARFSRSDLSDHLHKHYGPAHVVVAAAGNLKHEFVRTLIEKSCGLEVRRNGQLNRARIPKAPRPKKEVFEKQIKQAHVCIGRIGYGVKHRQRYPLLVLNAVLGEGMSSRLFQNIREKFGFAYSIYSFVNFLSDTGNFGVYIGTNKNNVSNSIELIHRELEKLRAKPISTAELNRTKAQLKGTMMLSLENMSSRMMRLGSGELLLGKHVTTDEVLRNVDAVTVDDVSETANRLFCSDHFSTVVIEPAAGKDVA